jgi:hypothetical protein
MTSPSVDPVILADLTTKYRERLPDELIAQVVQQAWTDLNTPARFDTYLPVLVRRIADERLRYRLRAWIVRREGG